MSSFTRKSIISALLVGSVLAGTAFTLPINQVINPLPRQQARVFPNFCMITRQAVPLPLLAKVSPP